MARCGVTTRSLTGRPSWGAEGTGPTASTPDGASRLRTFGFPAPRPLMRLELATTRGSPASDSRLNRRRCSSALGSSLALDPSHGLCAFPPAGDWQTGFRLFSRPYRDSFHLSLGVLVRYRTPHVFRLGRFALPYSDGNSSPPYSSSGNRHAFAYGAVTLFGCLFQGNSA